MPVTWTPAVQRRCHLFVACHRRRAIGPAPHRYVSLCDSRMYVRVMVAVANQADEPSIVQQYQKIAVFEPFITNARC